MGTEDIFNFSDNATRITNGAENPNLTTALLEFPQITDEAQRNIVQQFLTGCDNHIIGLMQRPDYSTDPQHKEFVVVFYQILCFFSVSYLTPSSVFKLREFKLFIVNHDCDLLEIITNLKAILVNWDDGFTSVNANKRKRYPVASTIPL